MVEAYYEDGSVVKCISILAFLPLLQYHCPFAGEVHMAVQVSLLLVHFCDDGCVVPVLVGYSVVEVGRFCGIAVSHSRE